jgi:hypothetical protein
MPHGERDGGELRLEKLLEHGFVVPWQLMIVQMCVEGKVRMCREMWA